MKTTKTNLSYADSEVYYDTNEIIHYNKGAYNITQKDSTTSQPKYVHPMLYQMILYIFSAQNNQNPPMYNLLSDKQ